jgi:hypothetical protein
MVLQKFRTIYYGFATIIYRNYVYNLRAVRLPVSESLKFKTFAEPSASSGRVSNSAELALWPYGELRARCGRGGSTRSRIRIQCLTD